MYTLHTDVYAEPGLYLLHELQRTCSSRALVTKYGEQFHAIRDGPYLRWKENETGPSNNGDGGGGDLTGHSDRAMFQAGKNVTIVSMLSWFL